MPSSCIWNHRSEVSKYNSLVILMQPSRIYLPGRVHVQSAAHPESCSQDHHSTTAPQGHCVGHSGTLHTWGRTYLSCGCHLKQFLRWQIWVMFDQQTLPWHPRIRYLISQKHLYEKICIYGKFYYYDSKKLSRYSSTDIHLGWVGYS